MTPIVDSTLKSGNEVPFSLPLFHKESILNTFVDDVPSVINIFRSVCKQNSGEAGFQPAEEESWGSLGIEGNQDEKMEAAKDLPESDVSASFKSNPGILFLTR